MSRYEKLKEEIKKHEGFSNAPYQLEYKDANGVLVKEGFMTGGYGHKIIPGEIVPNDKEGWDKLFEKDFKKALEGAEELLDGFTIKDDAKDVIIEMCYQMGKYGTAKFKRMFLALQIPDYVLAAHEMSNSKWAVQTPSRANRMAIKMRNNAT